MTLTIEKLQPRLTTQFAQVVASHRLAQGYLLVGPPGTGKTELAQWLAMSQFCQNLKDGYPCGECQECQRIQTDNHPDVVQIAPENQTIKVDAIRYLKSELYKSGMESSKRVFIILDADKMSINASNSLLKFLEEPVSDALIILTSTARMQILPTIISRLQVIDLHGPSRFAVQQNFVEAGLSVGNAQLFSLLTQDLVQAQKWLADDDFKNLLQGILRWFSRIFRKDPEAFVLVQTQLVANTKTKERQALAFQILISFYEVILHKRFAQTKLIAPDLLKLDQTAQKLSNQELLTQLNLLLDMQKQLRVNVSFENVLEALTLKLLKI